MGTPVLTVENVSVKYRLTEQKVDDLKDYFIESEEDIPEEYRKQLSTQIEEINSIPIISGEKGNVIEEENEIADIFGDEQTGYLGHGTIGGEEIVNLIFQTGLKVKNPKAVRSYDNHLRGVASTTIEWGEGEPDLFNKIKEKLRNWPHNEAKDIIIISIPKEYILSTAVRLGTDRYEAVSARIRLFQRMHYLHNQGVAYIQIQASSMLHDVLLVSCLDLHIRCAGIHLPSFHKVQRIQNLLNAVFYICLHYQRTFPYIFL